MFGDNPLRPPVKGDGSVLQIKEIFPTLQGEGPNTGQAAVFVRLGGCNLACDFCDTDFEEFCTLQLADITTRIDEIAVENDINLVVITGGEPLRQPITKLCDYALQAGYKVQIETNGTLWQELPEKVEVVCSPKASNGLYFPPHPHLQKHIIALKFVISAQRKPYDTIPEFAANFSVWLQPMDENDESKNRNNLIYAMQLAEKYGYKLSLQTHKLFGID